MNELDKAWVAGILDGEGYFGIHYSVHKNGREYWKIVVSVEMTHEPTIDRLLSLTGLGFKMSRPERNNHRQTFIWKMAWRESVELLNYVYQYLFTKKESADTIIKFSESTSNVTRIDLFNDLKDLNKRGRRSA